MVGVVLATKASLATKVFPRPTTVVLGWTRLSLVS